MLTDFQQDAVWQNWLGAEIRAAYFADLVQCFQNVQKALTVISLLFSSGATITLLTTIVPPQLGWIKPLLTLLSAAISFWSLVAKYERSATDCADLHFRWNKLAISYENLWGNMYADEAVDTLQQLREEEANVSKSSTSMPRYEGRLRKAQKNIVLHHQQQLTA